VNFSKILETHHDDNDDTRKANLIAVLVQLQTKGNAPMDAPFEVVTFEQMYNVACQLIESGKHEEAIELLDETAGTHAVP